MLSDINCIAESTFKALLRQRLTAFFLTLTAIFIGFGLLMSTVDIGVRFRLFENLLLGMQTFLLHIAGWLYLFEMVRKEQSLGLFVLPLTTTIKRSHYFIGRFLGVVWLMLLLLAFFAIIDSLLMLIISGSVNIGLLQQLYLLSLSALLSMATLYFLTTLVSPVNAIIYSVIIWFIGNGLDELLLFAEKKLTATSTELIRGLYYLWPNFSFFDKTELVANEIGLSWQQIAFPSIYSLLYSSLLLWAATLIYQRKALNPMAE
ncbi:MAG: hypothetical protein HOM11_11355 [Methylococcales bacterium]|jgi:hypothetical protein|nr:hypothetical protein [Methylococcales bacterium]MBT7442702.1 hypothetical protein [Methylococcales bacterium]